MDSGGPFGFGGQSGYYFDPETNLYLLGGGGRGRYYDPQLARFQNADPTGIASGDPNLYRYVANDPVNRRDPSGNQDPEIIPRNPTKAQYDRWVKDGMVTRYEGWTTDYFLVRLNGRKYVYQENTFSGVGVLLAQYDMAVDDADAFKSAFGKTISSTSTYSEAVGKGLQTSVKAARNAVTDTAVGLGTLGSYSGTDLGINATVTDEDLGYGIAYGGFRVAGEIGSGIATAGLSKAGNAGTAVAVWDAAGNAVGAARGISDIAENGLTVSNSVEVAAGLFGLGGSIAGARKSVSAIKGTPDAEGYIIPNPDKLNDVNITVRESLDLQDASAAKANPSLEMQYHTDRPIATGQGNTQRVDKPSGTGNNASGVDAPRTQAPDVRTLNPVTDPARPVYKQGHAGQPVVEHIKARAAGGHPTDPSNLHVKPWEWNARKGAYDGQLLKARQEYIRQGLTPAQADAVLSQEWEWLMNDVLARPMDPNILDNIPFPGSR